MVRAIACSVAVAVLWMPELCLAEADQDSSAPALPANPDPPQSVEGPAEEAFVPSLRVYGFLDVNFQKTYMPNTASAIVVGETGPSATEYGHGFLGDLNLYFDGQPAPNLRTLAEVRFMYTPNSARQSTATADYAHHLASVSWGSIDIERAWVEYHFAELFTLRAGQFFTPYGVWNSDHGSPTIITFQKPEAVSQEIMPERQVGLEGYGIFYMGDTRLGYHLTLSNGRIGNMPQYEKYTWRPGVGGRLFIDASVLGQLRLGVSGFAGRYIEGKDASTPLPGMPDTSLTQISQEYDEQVLAADVMWEWKGLVIIGEYVYGNVDYTKRGRPVQTSMDPAQPPSLAPDYHPSAAYGVLGYRLPFGLMPFIFVQRMESSSLPTLKSLSPGLNYRPLPALVLKGQMDFNYVSAQTGWVKAVQLQIAVAF